MQSPTIELHHLFGGDIAEQMMLPLSRPRADKRIESIGWEEKLRLRLKKLHASCNHMIIVVVNGLVDLFYCRIERDEKDLLLAAEIGLPEAHTSFIAGGSGRQQQASQLVAQLSGRLLCGNIVITASLRSQPATGERPTTSWAVCDIINCRHLQAPLLFRWPAAE